MPVTAKLSRKFYDTFGDEIANELVEWFNAVDATYRSELIEVPTAIAVVGLLLSVVGLLLRR